MTDSVNYDQNMVGGGEVMEVMMTGGDGGEMNEDTLAQVVRMLQMEGQLTGENHTIIIRQPGSSEIQMIQTTNSGGELIVSKASEADIQELQSGNGLLENVGQELLEGQGQVMLMDEGGNLVEGMVQMQEGSAQGAPEGDGGGVIQLPQEGQLQAMTSTTQASANLMGPKSDVENSNEILDGLVQIGGTQNLMENSLPPANDTPSVSATKPITITTTTTKARPKLTTGLNGEVVSIKISTGLARRLETKPTRISPKNVIKISTVTGQQKYQPPKFHKCEACAINFASKVAYMNHMDNCPSRRRSALGASTGSDSKGNFTYTCVFCETKFTSRLVLMQHVRTCDRAKSSKNLAPNSKLRVTTSESKLKLVSSGSLSTKGSIKDALADDGLGFKKSRKGPRPLSPQGKGKGAPGRKKLVSLLDPEDEPFANPKDMDSEDEDERDIVYDDDEDLNEEEALMEDDSLLEAAMAPKRSQKHLGPIIVRGMFKCRDCDRTFSKEHQYNRHVRACTNAPLNASRIDAADGAGANISNAPGTNVGASDIVTPAPPPPPQGVKRKRGRPPLKDYSAEDGSSPAKRRALGPKIVSVNPKKVGVARGRPPRLVSDSDDDGSDQVSSSGLSRIREVVYGRRNARGQSRRGRGARLSGLYPTSNSSLSKVVKISPSDALIKQTGRAILSKINKEKYAKLFREAPFCGLCGDKFKTNQELILHTQICHSEDLLYLRDSLDGKGNLSSLKCPLCDLYFVSSHVLLLHMVSFHDKDLRSVQEELETQNLNLVCPFCGDMNFTQDLLKEHLATRHLDRLLNKPCTTVSPAAIDVHALIKEKNNGSMLPTGTLLTKKEKVLCPECGLFFFKSYFEHHRCAAETFSHSARRFICSEVQCAGLSFFKLIHLLTHLQQVHEKSLPCHSVTFDSLTQFLEWLKREEGNTKMKYTKALQRMKQGKLSTVWICHRFHNAMKDPTSMITVDSEFKSDRLHQCYSRIHAETCYNMSTSRYDGKTLIRYYPDHRHPVEGVIKTEPSHFAPSPPVPVTEKPAPSVLQSFTTEQATSSTVNPGSVGHSQNFQKSLNSVPTGDADMNLGSEFAETSSFNSAFSDAAKLKQLLEDDEDDDFDRSKPKLEHVTAGFDPTSLGQFDSDPHHQIAPPSLVQVPVSLPGTELPSEERLNNDSNSSQHLPNEAESTLRDGDNESRLTSVDSMPILGEEPSATVMTAVSLPDGGKVLGEEESLPSSEISGEKMESKEEVKEMSGLVSFTDTDLLLEKMLGEHDGGEASSVVALTTATEESSHDSQEGAVACLGASLAPTEAKISDVDMLEAFGGCLTPEESSNPSTASTLQPEPESEHPEPPTSNALYHSEKVVIAEEREQDQQKLEEDPSQSQLQQEEPKALQEELNPDQQQQQQPPPSPPPPPPPPPHPPVSSVESSPLDKETGLYSKAEDEDDDDEEDEEENTYVLPADLEEWSKMFELVASQVSAGSLPDEELEEAKGLLLLEGKILSEQVEKQIHVFNRLCALAKVQMT